MGQVYTAIAFTLTATATVFCIIAMFRRYIICYMDYVNDVQFDKFPVDIIPTYNTWDMWWNHNSPYTWLQLLGGWVVLLCIAWTWIISVPVLVTIIVSTVHRDKIRKQKEFEKKLKGSEASEDREDSDRRSSGRAQVR